MSQNYSRFAPPTDEELEQIYSNPHIREDQMDDIDSFVSWMEGRELVAEDFPDGAYIAFMEEGVEDYNQEYSTSFCIEDYWEAKSE